MWKILCQPNNGTYVLPEIVQRGRLQVSKRRVKALRQALTRHGNVRKRRPPQKSRANDSHLRTFLLLIHLIGSEVETTYRRLISQVDGFLLNHLQNTFGDLDKRFEDEAASAPMQ